MIYGHKHHVWKAVLKEYPNHLINKTDDLDNGTYDLHSQTFCLSS